MILPCCLVGFSCTLQAYLNLPDCAQVLVGCKKIINDWNVDIFRFFSATMSKPSRSSSMSYVSTVNIESFLEKHSGLVGSFLGKKYWCVLKDSKFNYYKDSSKVWISAELLYICTAELLLTVRIDYCDNDDGWKNYAKPSWNYTSVWFHEMHYFCSTSL